MLVVHHAGGTVCQIRLIALPVQAESKLMRCIRSGILGMLEGPGEWLQPTYRSLLRLALQLLHESIRTCLCVMSSVSSERVQIRSTLLLCACILRPAYVTCVLLRLSET
jgi:hypothetical protein